MNSAVEPEAEGSLEVVPRVVRLVRDEDHRAVRLAEHAHDVLVGGGGADVHVDDEEHRVGEVDGDLGLIRGAIQPNGVAELSPAGYVPGPLPDVGG